MNASEQARGTTGTSAPRASSLPGRAPQPTSRSPITERQNEPAMLTLLRACTWHYRQARRWHLLKILGTVVLAAAAPAVTFWFPAAADGVAAAAGAWVLAGRTVLALAEQRQIQAGVTMQEQFDVALFRLRWNTSLAGPKAAAEDIADAARHITDDSHLRDWYAPTGDAPWPLDVLLCQRSSAVWGRRAHYGYGITIAMLGSAWFLAGIIMGLTAHLTLGGYLIKLFLPSQPAFLDTIELSRSHLRHSADKHAIEQQADALWEKGCRRPVSVTVADCRAVQDQAYRLRSRGPRVAQWFYQLRRGRDQQAMEAAARQLMDQLVPPARR